MDLILSTFYDTGDEAASTIQGFREAIYEFQPEDVAPVNVTSEDDDVELEHAGVGTSKQYDFTVGRRGSDDSVFASMARIGVEYLSDGVVIIMAVSLFKYVVVAILHLVLYLSLPDLGYYIESIDWEMNLMAFVIAFIFNKYILGMVGTYDVHPRACHDLFDLVESAARDLSTEVRATTPEVGDVYSRAILYLWRMSREIVAVFSEMETSASRAKEERLYDHADGFFRAILDLKAMGAISGRGAHRLRKRFDAMLDPIRRSTGFSKAYVASRLLSNHFKVVLNIYLYLFVPPELYARSGALVVILFPVLMMVMNMVTVLMDVMGQPFDFDSNRHLTDYRTWEVHAARRICTAAHKTLRGVEACKQE